MIISGLEANKMHFKTHCFVYKQSQKGLFCYIVLFLGRKSLQSRPWIGLEQRNLQRGFS